MAGAVALVGLAAALPVLQASEAQVEAALPAPLPGLPAVMAVGSDPTQTVASATAPNLALPAGALTKDHGGGKKVKLLPPELGVPMAVVTGLCYAAAANLASYVATKDAKDGKVRSRRQTLLIDTISLSGWIVGGFIITAAYASGCPVPVANATMVATNLVANMILQVSLRITYYDKSMQMGTVLFAIAVYQLAYIGPSPHEDPDLGVLLNRPQTYTWFLFLFVAGAISVAAIPATLNAAHDNFPKIVAWAVIISILGAGTDNAAVCLGMLEGWAVVFALALYGGVAFILLGLSAKAPALCDASTYVPLQLCIQMVINMLTGLFVWEDGKTIERMQPYLATFAICVLSVYLASSGVDLYAGIHHWHMRRRPLARSSLGKAVLELLACWQQDQVEPSEESKEDVAFALQSVLTVGLDRAVFQPADVAKLVVELQRKEGVAISAQVVVWMQETHFFRKYITGHPEFAKALQTALPPEVVAGISMPDLMERGGSQGKPLIDEDTSTEGDSE